MKLIIFLVIITFLPSLDASSQTISGTFPLLAGQEVRLEGFYGFDTYLIGSADVSEDGKFVLNYSEADYGIGQLVSEENRPFIVILSGEGIELKGESFDLPETIGVLKGKENLLFEQFANEHPRREQALSAWEYLALIYQQDSLFAIHEKPKTAIIKEQQRIKEEDNTFLASLDPNSYVSWFLPVRKLVSSVPTVAQYRTEEIPETIAAFRNIDYTDPGLYKSGLLRETIESHFWLIENSGRPLDSVFIEMNISIDHMIENLASDEKKLNEIAEYLFNLLERRSLFGASEYLALKVLNQVSCTIDDKLAGQLESYRAMKRGNIATDFTFGEDVIAPGYGPANFPKKLSDLKSDYTLVVFAASWCPQCTHELPEIARHYSRWKARGVEVVFVSLDQDRQTFRNFSGNFPFISTCDYKKWNSPIAEAYYVFGVPLMYLLDSKREILLRPNSVKQMDAWVDWKTGHIAVNIKSQTAIRVFHSCNRFQYYHLQEKLSQVPWSVSGFYSFHRFQK